MHAVSGLTLAAILRVIGLHGSLDLTERVLEQQIKVVAFALLTEYGGLVGLLHGCFQWELLIVRRHVSLSRCLHVMNGCDINVVVNGRLLQLFGRFSHLRLLWDLTILSHFNFTAGWLFLLSELTISL
jgi:hypothetical protein